MNEFSAEQRSLLSRHFTHLDQDVFGLVNLPEVVKGALFARYSRSSKGLRELFLDEFATDVAAVGEAENEVGAKRAEELYQRIFGEFGDDSVAQLGGAHVAVERASNLLTKQLEWGRLAAYLEQSTRYIPYDDRPASRWRYYIDPDVAAGPHADAYTSALDRIFELYSEAVPVALAWVRENYPRDASTAEGPWKAATRAKALDLLRGMLPTATTSNVGIFASGQSYEGLLLRLRASELSEARTVASQLLVELRKIIPSFLTRVDREDRGVVWSRYLADTRAETRALGRELLRDIKPDPAALVTLVDWSPRDATDADVALVAAMLFSAGSLPESQLLDEVRAMPAEDRARVIRAYVGDRTNRRHKPGRAFERIWYRFDVLGDYGGFRDLQRHRMCTIEWQDLTCDHGYDTPPELADARVEGRWHEALERSATLYGLLREEHPAQSQYAVSFAYRVRYVMQLNARAAMQMIELRSTPQGHPQYRAIVQQMHCLIREAAGHEAVAAAMSFVDHGAAELERLDAEKAAEQRRQSSGG